MFIAAMWSKSHEKDIKEEDSNIKKSKAEGKQ